MGQHSTPTGINCSNFTFQDEAQAYFELHPGDPEGLDGPSGPGFTGIEGVACENLLRRATTTTTAVVTTTTATTLVDGTGNGGSHQHRCGQQRQRYNNDRSAEHSANDYNQRGPRQGRHEQPRAGYGEPGQAARFDRLMLVHMQGFDPNSPSWLQWLSTLLMVASAVAHYLTGERWTIAGLLAGTALFFLGEFFYGPGQEEEEHSAPVGR